MTTNIIAIDKMDLHCPECGNTDPKQFTIITKPYLIDGLANGSTLSGVTCKVCEHRIGFEHVANSSWR